LLECVVNLSQGRSRAVIEAIAARAGTDLLDVHTDPQHNRAVLTLIGEAAPRDVAEEAVRRLDLRTHQGVHPRFGVVDVVPFVPLAGSTLADAIAARDRFAAWIAARLEVPAFLYGPERSLPEVRRLAFGDLSPAAGPAHPHPRAGAVAVGARGPLVAWNAYLADADLETATRIAAGADCERATRIAPATRSAHVRALGLAVGDEVQVSMNLINPDVTGPAEAWDLVETHRAIARAELVGLLPKAVLERIPVERWSQLDLSDDRTIEARLAQRARSGPG
jgi:glutamate formiminotransferase / 5-formyltetrahydrofolate cyclo-ligase